MTQRIALLLVDDEPILLEEIHDFLSWNGIAVTGAADGQRALAALQADSAITVVLTDLRMPFMDGLSLANRVMDSRSDADAVEVVLMTGHGNVQNAAEAVRAGAFDFLQKPMKLGDLLDVVRRAHAKAQGRRDAFAAREAEVARLKADYAALQKRIEDTGSPLDISRESPPELARILSHELRTPLIPLVALPDLLTDEGTLPPGMLHAHLLEVQSAGQRLSEIADDLIELLAPPAIRASAFLPVPLAVPLGLLLGTFLPSAQRDGIRLAIARTDTGSVETDETTLMQALSRLVRNALTAAAPARASIELSATMEPGDWVAFHVRDTGPGMTPPQLAVALRPFHQVDMSLTRRAGGMGLGLPLASRAANRLGGRLEMVSAPGQGTTASIILPRLHAAPPGA